MVASSPNERILIDTSLLFRIYVISRSDELYEKSESIIADFLVKAGKTFHLIEKLDKIRILGFF